MVARLAWLLATGKAAEGRERAYASHDCPGDTEYPQPSRRCHQPAPGATRRPKGVD